MPLPSSSPRSSLFAPLLRSRTTRSRHQIDVNGDTADPLYAYLKKELGSFPTADVKWNFGKFLVDGNGKPVKRYAPTDSPMSIEADIVALL